ncbi:MAG: hypothetical protein KF850_03550 [Labilithrix sp.]|nr:hypothetical protein [Labilithrix sp.]
MRSIFGRASIPFAALLLVSLSAPSAASASPSDAVVTRNGAPWILLGGRYAGPKTDDVEARARAIVAARAKASPVTIVADGVDRFADGETIVRYAQTHRGLPVIGRGASVRLSSAGQPIATVLDLEPELPARVDAVVSPAAAAAVATQRMPLGARAKDAHLVVWPTLDRGARLAYAVVPVVPPGIPTRPRVIVDAETSEVLEARDLVTFARANMYQFNPTKTPTPSLVELSLPTSGATLSNAFIEATNCVDNKTVKPVDMFGFNLNVHICDLIQTAAPNDDGDFLYQPSDVPGSAEARRDEFSEVSIYVHAAKAYAFFRGLAGEPEAQVVVDKPLRLVANLQVPAGMSTGDLAKAGNPDIPLETFQNAFFSPAGGGLGQVFQQLYGFDTGALWFGQGPKRDYAYDGDVVYHEFGHAVVDATLKLGAWHLDARGATAAPGAMNEALSDYFSSAITGDPDVGEYAAADLGAADGSVIRTLANEDACPTAVTGAVHFDSTLFSGGLWQARQSLPQASRDKFDAALYKAMRANPGNGDLGYDDLTNLFLSTLKTDLPQGHAALEKAMTERGVLPTCDRVLTFERAKISSPDKRSGFVAPGKQLVNVKGTAPGVIQVRAALPPNTAAVKVSFIARAGGGGGGSPFGGNAKPFAPVVLAKLGAPITWDAKSKDGHDADVKAAAASASGSTSATIELPEGTTADSIYVQIASTGDDSGAYDDVSLTFSARDGVGEGDVPPPDDAVTVTTTETGCSASPSSTRAAVFPGLLAAFAALTAWRRRRSTAR